MTPVLSKSELEEVTGLTQPAAQARWLTEHGVRFIPRRDGSVVTTWTAIDTALLSEKRTRPNLQAIGR